MNKKVFLAIFLLNFLPGVFFSVSGADAATLEDSDTVGLWLFDEFTYPHTTLTDASEYAKADSTEKVETWKGKSSVRSLEGRSVRLKFEMQEAKLYAFEFEN